MSKRIVDNELNKKQKNKFWGKIDKLHVHTPAVGLHLQRCSPTPEPINLGHKIDNRMEQRCSYWSRRGDLIEVHLKDTLHVV